jgi:hypothetical protein
MGERQAEWALWILALIFLIILIILIIASVMMSNNNGSSGGPQNNGGGGVPPGEKSPSVVIEENNIAEIPHHISVSPHTMDTTGETLTGVDIREFLTTTKDTDAPNAAVDVPKEQEKPVVEKVPENPVVKPSKTPVVKKPTKIKPPKSSLNTPLSEDE